VVLVAVFQDSREAGAQRLGLAELPKDPKTSRCAPGRDSVAAVRRVPTASRRCPRK
jgi:hypothetical protein